METLKTKIYNLLRWSEKYTKTDMVYLTKGSFWLTLGYAVSTGSAFLLAIAFANLLPKEVYGNYRYVLSLFGILAIPNLSGMETALTRTVAQGNEGSLMPVIKTRIRWGILGGIASLFTASYYYFFAHNPNLTMAFLITAAFLPLMDPLGSYSAVLTGKKLFGVSTKYFVITQIVSTAGLLTAILMTDNLFIILLAYFAPYTAMRYIYLKITLKKFQTNQNRDPNTISYGKHLSLMNVISTIATYLDRLLVFHYLGAVQLAIYSFAIALPEQIKALLKGIDALVLPKFSERTKEEIKQTIWGKVFRFGIAISVITIIYILAAPFVFKVFFPQYLDSVFYSQIFAISLLAGINTFHFSALQAQKAQKELYHFNIWSSLIEIFLLLVLLHFYGLMGIVLARVFTRFANSGLTFWLWKKV